MIDDLDKQVIAGQNTTTKKYWLDELVAFPGKSNLPYDHVKTAPLSPEPAVVTTTWAGELFQKLTQLANGSDLRLHIILATGLAALLHRTLDNNDITLGTPILNQESDGPFINTHLPIRSQLQEDNTFKDLLMQLGRKIMRAGENQNYPIDLLFPQLNLPATDMNGSPLFDISILLENIHHKKYLQDIPHNLSFIFFRAENNIRGTVEYNPALYDETTIQRTIDLYQHLLQQALTWPDRQIIALDMVPEEEKNRLLVEFNQTEASYPTHQTVHQWFAEQAARTPDHIAVVSPIDFSVIHRLLNSGEPDANLAEKLDIYCFKKNPHLFQTDLVLPVLKKPLTLLKTHRHNSLIVNANTLSLLDLFDGQRSTGSILSLLHHIPFNFFLFPVKSKDILEITCDLEGQGELFSSVNPAPFFLLHLMQFLYRHYLILPAGINTDLSTTSPTTIPTSSAGLSDPAQDVTHISDITDSLKKLLQGHREPSRAKVLLLGDTPGMPTTGLLYLGAYLQRNGISTLCLFNDSTEDYQSMKKQVQELLALIQPDIVAVSLKWFPFIARVLDICQIVKEYQRESGLTIKTVLGGNTASYYWEELIAYEQVDYLIRGDGEAPLLSICRGEAEPNIPNGVYKKNGQIFTNPIQYLQDETNSAAIYLSHLDHILLSPTAPLFGTFFIYTHKGCAMNCFYCGGCHQAQQKTFNRHKVLRRHVQEVRQDIREALKYTSTFQFDFDTFHDDLLDYCQQIWQDIPLSRFFCSITTITPPSPQFIELVARTFKYVYWDFDIASLSERHRQQLVSLGLVKPLPSNQEILQFLQHCDSYPHIEARINLINGFPYFTPADATTGEFFLAEMMERPSFSELHWARLHAQPGAPIAENAAAFQMVSYAASFSDFLKHSRENFHPNASYRGLENLNYPYIYYQDETLNSQVSRFYYQNNRTVQEHRDLKEVRAVPPMQLTYAQLDQKSGHLATRLQEKGIQPGHIVALMFNPSVDIPMAILAVLKTGGAYLPIDPLFPPERVDYMLKDSRASLLLDSTRLPAVTPPSHRPAYLPADSTNPAYIIYTSGTTGKPKGVILAHQNIVNYVSWFTRMAGLTSQDRTLLISSFAFDLGYTALYPSLLNGGQLHILPKDIYLLGQRLLSYIKENGITYIKSTPSLFAVMVNSPSFSQDTIRTLRLAVIGGEAIDLSDIKKAHDTSSNLRIINHYGPTEATIGCIARYIDFQTFAQYQAHPTIGTPIDNTMAYILDKHLNLQPIGIPGELYISGAGIATGYLNSPELTSSKFLNSATLSTKLYKTGDLARWLPEGTIQFLGRVDNQIKIRGYRVELGEIENRLLTHPQIKEAVVFAKESNTGDKYLAAYFVPRSESSNPSPTTSLSPDEQTRYKRQMLLRGWGPLSQDKLKHTTVFVAGAGGGASPTVTQLALAGFGTIIICDHDTVELSNLNRQFLHDESRIGMNKALSAQMTIHKINPNVTVIPITEKLTPENVAQLVGDAAIIFDMFDSPADKFTLAQTAARNGIPHIVAAMADIGSYAAIFYPPTTPCYHCLFDKTKLDRLVEGMKAIDRRYEKKPLPVMAPSLFTSTGFAVTEAIKIILGLENPAYNKFIYFNQGGAKGIGESESFRAMTYIFSDFFRATCKAQGFDWEVGWRGNLLEELTIKPDPQCPLCGVKSNLAPKKQEVAHIDPVPADKVERFSLSQLPQFLAQSLPDYMIPAHFIQLEKIPLTPNGKVDKSALPEPGTRTTLPGEERIGPRDELEEQLSGIWAEVLGIEKSSIAIDDNFFQLGGHSLKVTFLLSKMQSQFNRSLSLAEVFAAATIRQLAEHIKIPPENDVFPVMVDENLILLSKGTHKDKHLFLVHAGSGDVDVYLEFCTRLNADFNYWGIRSTRITDYAPVATTIEEIAAQYIKKIKHLQPIGPYHLAGWCIGGTIAFEIVRQLEQENLEIAFFALINTSPPDAEKTSRIRHFNIASEKQWLLEMLPGHPDGFAARLNPLSQLSQLWPEIVDYLVAAKIDAGQIRPLFPLNMADAVPNFNQAAIPDLVYYLNTIRTFDNARNAYIPAGKNKTPVYFIGADRSPVKNREKWQTYSEKPIEFHPVPGDHFSIFKIPEVTRLAETFETVRNQKKNQ